MNWKPRFLTGALLVGLSLSLAGGLSCQRAPSVIVEASNLPAQQITLEAQAILGSRVSDQTIELHVDPAAQRDTYSFALRPPIGSVGMLTVAVSARDANGCLLRIGLASLALDPLDSDDHTIPIALSELPTAARSRCFDRAPALFEVSQPDSAMDTVVVSGWGLRPDMEALLDGQPLKRRGDWHWDSQQFELPALRSPTGTLGKKVSLRAPVGDPQSAELLLRTLWFKQPSAPRVLPADLAPHALSVADLDGDKLPEIVLGGGSQGSGRILILRNQGGGLFTEQQEIRLDGSVSTLQMADMDKDGDLDLVLVRATPSQIVIIPNLGGGRFATTDWATYSHDTMPDYGDMVINDFNRDGYNDIAILNKESSGVFSSKIEIALNNKLPHPSLSYKSTAKSNVNGSPSLMLGIAPIDLNRDGNQDLLATEIYFSAENGVITLASYLDPFEGDGQGNFSLTKLSVYSQSLSGGTPALTVQDIDADGFLDVVSSTAFKNPPVENKTLDLLFVNANPNIFAFNHLDLPLAPAFTLIEDMNQDQKRDLIVINTSDNVPARFMVMPNQGNRVFIPETAPIYTLGVGPTIGAVADLDNDGRLDLVTASAGSPSANALPELRMNLNITPLP